MRAVLIPLDVNEPIRDLDVDGEHLLADLYPIIAPDSERAQVIDSRIPGVVMWIDEEAKVRDPAAPVNERATLLANLQLPGDYVAGNAVLTGESGSDTIACPHDAEAIAATWQVALTRDFPYGRLDVPVAS